VTIIGAVAAKYPSLAWRRRLPLFGKSICITRAGDAQSELARAFEELGAEVIRFPTTRIVPAPAARLAKGIKALAGQDWVVFTSANGVETFFAALARAGRDSRALAGTRVAAVGPATAQALLAGGIKADLVPAAFTGKALLAHLIAKSQKGERFLLWCAAGAREELARGLRRKGRRVTEVVAYRTTRPLRVDAALKGRLNPEPPSAVLFASASAARNFVDILGRKDALRLRRATKLISIGPATSAAMRKLALAPHSEAAVHTSQGLLQATLKTLRTKRG
jgi:uroporphyrinogen III methyltransferase/synthase